MSVSNMRQLAIHRMSVDAIPPGGGFSEGVNFLLDATRLAGSAREADGWARAAVAVVRAAGDPNPWKHSSDEEIAGELLRRIEEHRRSSAVGKI